MQQGVGAPRPGHTTGPLLPLQTVPALTSVLSCHHCVPPGQLADAPQTSFLPCSGVQLSLSSSDLDSERQVPPSPAPPPGHGSGRTILHPRPTDPHVPGGSHGNDSERSSSWWPCLPPTTLSRKVTGRSQELRICPHAAGYGPKAAAPGVRQELGEAGIPSLLLRSLLPRKPPLTAGDELTVGSRPSGWVGGDGTGKETKMEGNATSFRWTGRLTRTACLDRVTQSSLV